jgi:hypothetical protein
MQPTNPEPSSAEPLADTEATEASSEQSTPASRNFLQRLFRGRGSQEPEPQDQPDEAPASDAVTLTQEELDRRVQAETDRRERVRLERAASERKRKLRDEDPWAFAEEERNAERQAEIDAQNNAWMGNVGATHDRFTIDPVVMTLPESERNRIMSMPGAGVGLDGRRMVVTESLKALEKQWKAEATKDAEEKLRRNPAFRKQVLNEFRRGAASEPEFIGSGAPSASDSSVSNILREQIRARH